MVGMRNYPLMIGAGVAILLSGLVGAAAITGVLPTQAKQGEPAKPVLENTATAAAAKKASCRTCGVIRSVNAVEVKPETSGVGAVAGGVAGAVVGNVVGDDFGRNGRALATVVGAAGGALAGNEIEKQTKKQTVYRITVRMDDGSERTLTQASAPAFAVGARVRVNGNALERG
jgi:outer membrane lipoprotein SlyB